MAKVRYAPGSLRRRSRSSSAWLCVLLGVAGTLLLGGRMIPFPARPLPGLATSPHYRGQHVSVAERSWLATGEVPGAGTPWERMSAFAMLDLHRMVPPPAVHAGISAGAAPAWAYAWPRDSAFAASAMARTGHAAEAEAALRFLQEVQEADGGFEARYRLDGAGTPDARPRQSDGAGWVLWALDDVSAHAATDRERLRILQERRPLLDRATAFTLTATAQGRQLPRPSPDYWEVPEPRITLGVVAPLLAGLQASSRMYAGLGEAGEARRLAVAAARFETVLVARFGPGGFQRYGATGQVDAAVCFLLQPFVALAAPAPVLAAWQAYQHRALRPAGGLAPGAGWRDDGVSWTPETALVAFTAASIGDRLVAERWLRWIDAHRTRWQSIPEKVLPDGSPAGPAPLTWSAALVVLGVQLLSDQR